MSKVNTTENETKSKRKLFLTGIIKHWYKEFIETYFLNIIYENN